jgi:hypothetical protein
VWLPSHFRLVTRLINSWSCAYSSLMVHGMEPKRKEVFNLPFGLSDSIHLRE